MREKARIKRILKLLQEYWERNQDFRFGQMLINMGIIPDNFHVWLKEDDELENHLKKLNQKN